MGENADNKVTALEQMGNEVNALVNRLVVQYPVTYTEMIGTLVVAALDVYMAAQNKHHGSGAPGR